MSNTVNKPSPKRIELGDDMDDFVFVLDPARRVKLLDDDESEERKKKTTALPKDVVPGRASMPQGNNAQNSSEPPTLAMKKALDDYHADMRKLAEDSMPERDGLCVACEDWFCANRGSSYFDLGKGL
ncbi:hypothetical protein FLAG1_10282 [Fusarium langsethiae]|uniref:Uncharacterized protein n=1 Tax=Fusarium langsethiae TaxID=179993 RepID=A0A0M9EPH4_FUSLA|nr:hypothetical protein FLAG1_10282 [Fusarium langsethiae]GKU07879.1 unnamed protein product [Fusarium langsethiae]GKU12818.1 unnamed protein product [Fusarium langsethiae]